MRVLIVDDHETIRQATIRILETRSDIACIEARNAQEALDKAIHSQPDVILLDINMPGADGFSIARGIQQHAPKIPILFFSLHDDSNFREAAKALGQGVVLKDRAGTMLLDAVDTVMKGKRFFHFT